MPAPTASSPNPVGSGQVAWARYLGSAVLRAVTCGMFCLAWYRVSERAVVAPTQWGEHPFGGPFVLLDDIGGLAQAVFSGYAVLVFGCSLAWTLTGRNLTLGLMVSAIVASIAASYHLMLWLP